MIFPGEVFLEEFLTLLHNRNKDIASECKIDWQYDLEMA